MAKSRPAIAAVFSASSVSVTPRFEDPAAWLEAVLPRALERRPLLDWCHRVMVSLGGLPPKVRTPALVSLFQALPDDHYFVGSATDVEQEVVLDVPAWTEKSRPDPDLRMPMYNYLGPATSVSLGELYPLRALWLSAQVHADLMKACVAVYGDPLPILMEFYVPPRPLPTVRATLDQVRANRLS